MNEKKIMSDALIDSTIAKLTTIRKQGSNNSVPEPCVKAHLLQMMEAYAAYMCEKQIIKCSEKFIAERIVSKILLTENIATKN